MAVSIHLYACTFFMYFICMCVYFYNTVLFWPTEGQLGHLLDLGFRKEDCKRALVFCKGEATHGASIHLIQAEIGLGFIPCTHYPRPQPLGVGSTWVLYRSFYHCDTPLCSFTVIGVYWSIRKKDFNTHLVQSSLLFNCQGRTLHNCTGISFRLLFIFCPFAGMHNVRFKYNTIQLNC